MCLFTGSIGSIGSIGLFGGGSDTESDASSDTDDEPDASSDADDEPNTSAGGFALTLEDTPQDNVDLMTKIKAKIRSQKSIMNDWKLAYETDSSDTEKERNYFLARCKYFALINKRNAIQQRNTRKVKLSQEEDGLDKKQPNEEKDLKDAREKEKNARTEAEKGFKRMHTRQDDVSDEKLRRESKKAIKEYCKYLKAKVKRLEYQMAQDGLLPETIDQLARYKKTALKIYTLVRQKTDEGFPRWHPNPQGCAVMSNGKMQACDAQTQQGLYKCCYTKKAYRQRETRRRGKPSDAEDMNCDDLDMPEKGRHRRKRQQRRRDRNSDRNSDSDRNIDRNTNEEINLLDSDDDDTQVMSYAFDKPVKGFIAPLLLQKIFSEPQSDKERQNTTLFKGTSVTIGDIHTLKKGEWLNDAIINEFLNLIPIQDNNTSVLSTYYTQSKISSERAKRLFDGKRYVYIPINKNNSHWFFMKMDLQRKTIQVYDSLHTHRTKWLKERLTKNFPLDIQEFTFEETPEEYPEQGNGVTCGVYTCIGMLYLLTGKEFDFDDDMLEDYGRKFIGASILQKSLREWSPPVSTSHHSGNDSWFGDNDDRDDGNSGNVGNNALRRSIRIQNHKTTKAKTPKSTKAKAKTPKSKKATAKAKPKGPIDYTRRLGARVGTRSSERLQAKGKRNRRQGVDPMKGPSNVNAKYRTKRIQAQSHKPRCKNPPCPRRRSARGRGNRRG